MKTFSSRTLLAMRRERELVGLSIVLYRRLRTATGCECAELFTRQKNRETIADIKGLVSARRSADRQPDVCSDEPTDQPSQNRRDIKTNPDLFHFTNQPRQKL